MKQDLAILGGTPVLRRPLAEINNIGRNEISAALKVLRTGKLSCFVASNTEEFLGGPWVDKLEKCFSSYFSRNYAVSMNSATSALYAAVYALGIQQSDEVIVTPYTMSASATAVLACSAVPVFVDVNVNNYCVDADKIEEAITKRTKAIIVVHLFGNPAEMDKIMRLAKKYRLSLIEDCAQSPGAKYQERFTGCFGDVGVFSLNRHKTIQTGEGGVAVTDSKDIAFRLRLIRNHAEAVLDQMPAVRTPNLIGWNYKMTELEAAVGAEQIKKLDRLNLLRIRNADYLDNEISRFDWIVLGKKEKKNKSVYYRYPFRFIRKALGIRRSTLASAMFAEGFALNEGYVKPLYLQPVYKRTRNKNAPYLAQLYNSGIKYVKGICPVAESLHRDELLLSNLTHLARSEYDIDNFISALRKVEYNVTALKRYEKNL